MIHFFDMLCPVCRLVYSHPLEVENIENLGQCLGCEKLESDSSFELNVEERKELYDTES